MTPNLKAELTRDNIDERKISALIKKNTATIRSKIDGSGDFSRREMFAIRDALYPRFSLDYLFDEIPRLPKPKDILDTA